MRRRSLASTYKDINYIYHIHTIMFGWHYPFFFFFFSRNIITIFTISSRFSLYSIRPFGYSSTLYLWDMWCLPLKHTKKKWINVLYLHPQNGCEIPSDSHKCNFIMSFLTFFMFIQSSSYELYGFLCSNSSIFQPSPQNVFYISGAMLLSLLAIGISLSCRSIAPPNNICWCHTSWSLVHGI